MKILFTICGRAGSKGIKNKNIRSFFGKPLPLYTLSAIDLLLERNSCLDGTIAVNTDSSELIDILCNGSDCKVHRIDRKKELAGDRVSKIAVIKDTLNEIQKISKKKYDMVVDLDITSPLRTVKDIYNLITVHQEKGCDVTFSVTEARRNPYFNMVTQSDKGYGRVIKSNFVTRQESPVIYDMNASLYAYDPVFLASEKEIFEGYCEIIKMYDTAILDLDHESDFELMEVIAQYLYRQYPEFSEVEKHCLELFNR